MLHGDEGVMACEVASAFLYLSAFLSNSIANLIDVNLQSQS